MSHIQPRSINQKQDLKPDKEKARKESQTVTKEHLQVHSKSLGETLTHSPSKNKKHKKIFVTTQTIAQNPSQQQSNDIARVLEHQHKGWSVHSMQDPFPHDNAHIPTGQP